MKVSALRLYCYNSILKLHLRPSCFPQEVHGSCTTQKISRAVEHAARATFQPVDRNAESSLEPDWPLQTGLGAVTGLPWRHERVTRDRWWVTRVRVKLSLAQFSTGGRRFQFERKAGHRPLPWCPTPLRLNFKEWVTREGNERNREWRWYSFKEAKEVRLDWQELMQGLSFHHRKGEMEKEIWRVQK
ncbi:hypothetical protein RRG08_023196 [Elysia crispata]|uniref:Uncharacterized protein n=1 Tax=Elysia crispata TaxID=231223 RepID=A0AAE1DJS1_9GAST|nr:hypothetical protein RRG08_023196 [Elysia crispata]